MLSTEVLRTQLDNLRLEKQRLEAENARLRNDRQEEAELLDAEARSREENARLAAENSHLRKLYDQLLKDKQEEPARASECEKSVHELARKCEESEKVGQLQNELEERTLALEENQYAFQQRQQEAELEVYRATDAERKKWEAREERLVRQLEEAQRRLVEASDILLGDPHSPTSRYQDTADSHPP